MQQTQQLNYLLLSDQIDWEYWKKQKLWPALDALKLLLNINPASNFPENFSTDDSYFNSELEEFTSIKRDTEEQNQHNLLVELKNMYDALEHRMMSHINCSFLEHSKGFGVLSRPDGNPNQNFTFYSFKPHVILEWASQQNITIPEPLLEHKSVPANEELHLRTENTYLRIIAGLMHELIDSKRSSVKYGTSQTPTISAIAKDICAKHFMDEDGNHIPGLKERNVREKLSEAHKNLKSAK